MYAALSRFCLTNAQKVFTASFVIGYFVNGPVKLPKGKRKKSRNLGLMEAPFEPVPFNYNIKPGHKPITSWELLMTRAQNIHRHKTEPGYQDIQTDEKELKPMHYNYDSMKHNYAL
ncbi:uncharacterized protein LOC112493975 [Cephus cinctus]|uniref:Uncharacterized protein LOC112493975 n=1 Tax=Cephus cinctus TaxID=211228 RepID=A0AAJ7RCB6_CEPCN|nr:uncharacterized protein LOC112493975 [Cephus cinctus]